MSHVFARQLSLDFPLRGYEVFQHGNSLFILVFEPSRRVPETRILQNGSKSAAPARHTEKFLPASGSHVINASIYDPGVLHISGGLPHSRTPVMDRVSKRDEAGFLDGFFFPYRCKVSIEEAEI
jgi:hypothetical protein